MHTRIARWAAVAVLASAILGGAAAHASPGSNPRATHANQHLRPTHVLGDVLSVATGSFQLQPVYTMPVSVTVSLSTTITIAGMPGTMTDIQSGRFVNVAGHFDTTQQTLDASRVDVVVPTVSGKVTAVSGASFTLGSSDGATFQVTTSSTTQMIGMLAGKHHGRATGHGLHLGQGQPGNQPGQGGADNQPGATTANPQATVATGDNVLVQAFAPAAGSNAVTALRVWIGSSAADPGENAMDSSD